MSASPTGVSSLPGDAVGGMPTRRRHCSCRRHAALPPAGRIEDIARAFDIGLIQLPRIERAQPVVRGDMKQRLASGQRVIERGAIGQIALDDFDRRFWTLRRSEPLRRQRPDLPPLPQERTRNSSADKPGRARNQRSHDSRVSNADGASEPVLAMVARERLAARYRCASRIKGARSAGASANAPMRRQICRCPSLSAAAVTARGNTSAGAIDDHAYGHERQPCVRLPRATARLSMSTAAAPVRAE